jgi:hypothetical protein
MSALAPLGRMLAAFGLGVLATRYYPGIAGPLGLPAAVVGALALIAAPHVRPRRPDGPDPSPIPPLPTPAPHLATRQSTERDNARPDL